MSCKKNYLPYFVLLVLFLSTSCSSYRKMHPLTHSRSETLGAGITSFGLSASRAYRVQVAEDFRTDPVVHSPNVKESVAALFYFNRGLFDAMDFELAFGPDLPLYAGIKLRPFNFGNFSFSFKLGSSIAVSAGEVKASEVRTSSNVKTSREWVMNSYSFYFGGSLGYRFAAPLLVYGTFMKENFGQFVRFETGIADRISLDGSQKIFALGAEYKLGVLTLGLQGGKIEIMFDQDPAKNSDMIFYALDVGMAL